MKQKKEIDIEILEQLLKEQTSESMMFQAINILYPNKSNYVSFIIIISLCFIPSILIGMSLDTIQLIKTTLESIYQVMLGLLGIVFAGYAFFQALINKELLIWMLGTDEKKSKSNNGIRKSRLQISNEYFVKIMMLQSMAIIIGLLLVVSISAIPEDWYLFGSNLLNNIIATFLLWLYFSCNFLIIWEIKSFVFNLYQIFNAYSVATVLSMTEDNDENEL